MTRTYTALLASVAALLLLLGACTRQERRDVVVVSTPQQAWLLSQIGGEDLQVVTLLPSGADAETYEVSVADLRNVQDAHLWFTIGNLPFEDALRENLKSASMEVVEGPVPQRHSIEDDAHILASIENARSEARLMADRLAALYPDSAASIRRRHDAVQARLTAASDSITAILADAPSRTFAIWHPSLAYFARENDLQQVAMECHGKESGPKQLREHMDEAREGGAAIFLVDRSHNPEKSRSTAASMGLKSSEIDLGDPDIINQLITTAHAIAGR